MEKDEIKFECTFNKELKPEDVSWYQDGTKLKDGDLDGRVKLESDGKKQYLILKNVQLDDAGNFEIRVKDVKSAASLKVKGT